MDDLDFTASRGVAIREFPLEVEDLPTTCSSLTAGRRRRRGQEEGTTLSGVDTQSGKYLDGLPVHVRRVGPPLPFAYESTGVETVFTGHARPRLPLPGGCSRSTAPRRSWVGHATGALRARLRTCRRSIPPACGMCQVEAIEGPRALPRGEQAALADPDGDRQRQDVHGRATSPTGYQARRGAAGPVPGGPHEPRAADPERVPAVREPDTARSSPSLQRAAPCGRRHRPRGQGVHLDHPAPVLDAPGRGADESLDEAR